MIKRETIYPAINNSWSLEMVYIALFACLLECLHINLLSFYSVPCIRRARQMEYTEDEDQETQVKDENDDGDDWMYTHSTRGKVQCKVFF